MKKIILSLGVSTLLTLSPIAGHASQNGHYGASGPLNGTIYTAPAIAVDLDPLLLYSVALAESSWIAEKKGDVQPNPYTLRVASLPGYYTDDLDTATAQLQSYLAKYSSIDIGFLQVNSYYHGHRVDNLFDLLDPVINLQVGAEILRETIDSAPGDLELGIGRYHHWADEVRARSYGARIIAIYNNLRAALR